MVNCTGLIAEILVLVAIPTDWITAEMFWAACNENAIDFEWFKWIAFGIVVALNKKVNSLNEAAEKINLCVILRILIGIFLFLY